MKIKCLSVVSVALAMRGCGSEADDATASVAGDKATGMERPEFPGLGGAEPVVISPRT